MDLKYYVETQQDQAQMAPATKHLQTPPKLQSSYSTNDIPTMKSTSNGLNSLNGTPNSHAQQHFHNHNASLGRIPPNAVSNRQSRDLSAESPSAREVQSVAYQSIQSALQANAPAFGPTSQNVTQAQSPPAVTAANVPGYSAPAYYNPNYNMQMMTIGMQNLQMGQPVYQPQSAYTPYGNVYPQNGVRDSQARVIQQRRQTDGEGMPLNIHDNFPS